MNRSPSSFSGFFCFVRLVLYRLSVLCLGTIFFMSFLLMSILLVSPSVLLTWRAIVKVIIARSSFIHISIVCQEISFHCSHKLRWFFSGTLLFSCLFCMYIRMCLRVCVCVCTPLNLKSSLNTEQMQTNTNICYYKRSIDNGGCGEITYTVERTLRHSTYLVSSFRGFHSNTQTFSLSLLLLCFPISVAFPSISLFFFPSNKTPNNKPI